MILPIALVLLCSCAGDAADGNETVNAVAASIDLEIGRLDGPEEYTFGRVSGLTTDEAGRIYVVDAMADVVRVFDSQGEFMFNVGRSGSGPGELSGACCITIDNMGRLWVRDGGNRRYNAYSVGDTAAEYLETRRMAHNAGGLWAPTTLVEPNLVIDVGSEFDAEQGSQVVRLFLDSASNVVKREIIPQPPLDSLGQANVERSEEGGTAVYYFYQPYGAMYLRAHSPLGGWARVVSSNYAVRWHGPDESFNYLLTRDVIGPLVSDGERARGEEQLENQRERGNLSRRDLPFDVPERKAPIRWLQFDSEGRLWVFRTAAEDEANTADVYDRDGELSFGVTWPAEVGLRFGYLGDGVALGTTRDSLDVQRVVRLRFGQ
ncbi:MAG: 6-bladed beta-propeller [Gemmatimonadota bacterium]|nr:MAG: 6-bladed beta-propeller [Gemmatimonadota bacterium]